MVATIAMQGQRFIHSLLHHCVVVLVGFRGIPLWCATSDAKTSLAPGNPKSNLGSDAGCVGGTILSKEQKNPTGSESDENTWARSLGLCQARPHACDNRHQQSCHCEARALQDHDLLAHAGCSSCTGERHQLSNGRGSGLGSTTDSPEIWPSGKQICLHGHESRGSLPDGSNSKESFFSDAV